MLWYCDKHDNNGSPQRTDCNNIILCLAALEIMNGDDIDIEFFKGNSSFFMPHVIVV